MAEKTDVKAHPQLVSDASSTEHNAAIAAVPAQKESRRFRIAWRAPDCEDPGPPPDGGAIAWAQVLAGHLIVMNTWGFMNSFGVFQTFYVDFIGRNPSDVSWIGSIQVFLTFFLGTFTGRLTDAGYFRPVFFFGTVISLLGMFMASLSTEYWQLFLAQGVCCGIGNGFLFCPMVAVVSTYFAKKKPIAVGICACGGSTGGLIFPAMVQQLLPLIGFPWTMRVIGLVTLALLSLCNFLARPRLPPRQAGPILELAAFKELPYTLFAASMFFVFWGVYFASFYLGSFGVDVIGFTEKQSINLLLVLNGVGVLGRTIPAYVANNYAGPINVLLISTIASVVCSYAMVGLTNKAGFYAWTVVYGIAGNAVQGMFPVALSALSSTDLKKVGVRMGMIFTIVGFAVLTGPPITGVLITAANGKYMSAQIFAASSMLLGFFLLLWGRYLTCGKTLMVKV